MARAFSMWLAVVVGLWWHAPAYASGSGTSGDPYTALSDAYRAPASGRYYFDLGSGVFQADVDTSEGDGWVLILQYVHQNNTANPALSILGAGSDMPVTSTAALGADESADTARWGHAGNAAMSQFAGDIELRWYAETSDHSRIIHFRSTIGDDYVRTGSGSFAGINSDFTSLTGHSANIPAAVAQYYTNEGDLALTEFPYWLSGTYHWGIRGLGNRWEVDNTTHTNTSIEHDTIHRVWVRAANPLEVTNTNESGEGSLRQAIEVANADADRDAITFAIPGTGPHRITVTSQLPEITDAGVIVDGTTQSGASCGNLWAGTPHTLQIEVYGSNQVGFSAMRVFGDTITIKGMALTGSRNGVYVDGASDNVAVQCNYLGLAPDGTTVANERGAETNGSNTLIGGSTAGAGNVISGNLVGVVTMAGSSATSIIGNFIGTDPSGTSASANTIGGITNQNGSASWATISGNVISGNGTSGGIYLQANDTVTGSLGDALIVGNYIGVDRTGSAALGNSAQGIRFIGGSSSGITIGGSAASDRNIISSNGGGGVYLDNMSDITLLGNYIGLAADGSTAQGNSSHGIEATATTGLVIGGTGAGEGNVISANSGGGTEGIWLRDATDAVILGNFIGTDSSGTLDRGNGDEGIVVQDGASATIGDGTVAGRNVIAGNSGANIYVVRASASADIRGNLLGIGVGGQALGGEDGVHFSEPSSGTVRGNTIAHNNRYGVLVRLTGPVVSMLENSIHSNGSLGIELNLDGVSANDTGDGDTGPNELLNFPVLSNVSAGMSNLYYAFDLDVPTHTEGYRIDFYKNSSADSSGHGEGEIWLGSMDTGVYTAGSSLSFSGNFAPAASIAAGDIVSATTTRKTGASTYDITSEFAANAIIVTPLIVTNTDDSGTGSLRNAITFANANASEDNITFAIPGDASTVHTITLGSTLPEITDADIVIDGTTQGDAACGDLWAGTPHTLRVELYGPSMTNMLLGSASSNVTIKGLAITGNGVLHGIDAFGSNHIIQCNYIGVKPDGTSAGHGVGIIPRGTDILIGGLGAGEGNIISASNNGVQANVASSAGAMIRGNFIGTDPTGMSALPNVWGYNHYEYNNTLSDITQNLISGNSEYGIYARAGTLTGSSGDISIAGNIIGLNRTGTAALANGIDGIRFDSGVVSGATIGGTTTADRNVISGNTNSGINLIGADDVEVLGNYLGLDSAGATAIGNGHHGLRLENSTNIAVGNGTADGRNVISGNSGRGALISGGSSISVEGNYIGVAADGATGRGNGQYGIEANGTSALTLGGASAGAGNIISGNTLQGVWFENVSTSSILGNTIGLGADGSSNVGNSGGGIQLETSTDITVGDGTSAGGNTIGHNSDNGVGVVGGTNISVLNNRIGVQADGTTPASNEHVGILFISGATGLVQSNIVANSQLNDGVEMEGSATVVTIIENAIYGNAQEGIEIDGGEGVNANDTGDGDSGPNNMLNFPVLRGVGPVGSDVAYSINLDVPANTDGYRIDFYKNAAADASGHGEGETWLGFVDTGDHAGGLQTYSGTFTPNVTVDAGDQISATATRKTGMTTYAETSEFSVTIVGGTADLEITVTSQVYDPSAANSKAVPGSDIIYEVTITNSGELAIDSDQLEVISQIPSDTTFYNAATPELGNAVFAFDAGSTGLTFTPASDVAFSNSSTPPADFSACNYAPSAGYDTAVTFVCFNPKGSMNASGSPSATLQYRVRID